MIQIETPFIYLATEIYDIPKMACSLNHLIGGGVNVMFMEFEAKGHNGPAAVFYIDGEEKEAKELTKNE